MTRSPSLTPVMLMARYRLLFRCIGEALAAHGLKCLLGVVPFGERLYDIARDAQQRYKQQCQVQEAVAQVEAVARASLDEVRVEARAVFAEVKAAAAPEVVAQLSDPQVEQALVGYLEQVPAAVRASLRRPADPSGKSVPPGFSVQKPEDFLRLLPARPPRFQAGQRPVGNWELVELLGVGGFGEVWKATHPHFRNLTAALKFCLDGSSARYLRHEAGLLDAMMAHSRTPGIVELRNVHLDHDPPCLEYEYVNGGDLCGLLQDWLPLSPAQRVARTALLIRRLAATLAPLHRLSPPIVHRDLKPANILLGLRDGGEFDVKIGDFGIGGLATRQAVAAYRGMSQGDLLSQSLRGSHTPLYASPEQMRGGDPDPRDDVHALGVIWYQLLTGDLARGFGGDADEDLREAGVDEPTIALIRRCVARADRRLGDAGMLAEQIAALAVEDEPAPPTPRPASTARPTAVPTASGWSSLSRTTPAAPSFAEEMPSLAPQPASTATPAAAPTTYPAERPPVTPDPYDLPDLNGSDLPLWDRRPLAIVAMCGVGLMLLVFLALWLARSTVPAGETVPAGTKAGETSRVSLGGGVEMTFAWCPPGTFVMGSPSDEPERSDDETPHRVTLTQGFWLGVHEVTQKQWRAVLGSNPSRFLGDDLPVENVSWDDCQVFWTKLGEKTGKRFRLPTEAEWEYACRAGTRTPFHFGDTISTEQANYDGNYTYWLGKKGTYREKTTPVGSLPANAWGLYDMHGNVWEWCQDWYGAYRSKDIKDPQDLSNGNTRVLRGGSWSRSPRYCRAACRLWNVLDRVSLLIRVVRLQAFARVRPTRPC